MQAGAVLSLVGSLSVACLRLSGALTTARIEGPLEIVSATGTVCPSGLHVHIGVADDSGIARGGHLLPGCIVRTTAEVVLCDLSLEWRFERADDEATGYKELVIARQGKDG